MVCDGESETVGVVDGLQSMHPRHLQGYRYAALATKSCGALAQSPPPTRSKIQPGRRSHRDWHWMPNLLCWDERTGDHVITSTTHKPLHPPATCMCSPARNAAEIARV
jgi:hypothetical protein